MSNCRRVGSANSIHGRCRDSSRLAKARQGGFPIRLRSVRPTHCGCEACGRLQEGWHFLCVWRLTVRLQPTAIGVGTTAGRGQGPNLLASTTGSGATVSREKGLLIAHRLPEITTVTCSPGFREGVFYAFADPARRWVFGFRDLIRLRRSCRTCREHDGA